MLILVVAKPYFLAVYISHCNVFHRLYVEILALTRRLRLSPTDTLDLVDLASPSGWTTSSVSGQSTTSPPVSPLALEIPLTAPTMKMPEYDVTVSCRCIRGIVCGAIDCS